MQHIPKSQDHFDYLFFQSSILSFFLLSFTLIHLSWSKSIRERQRKDNNINTVDRLRREFIEEIVQHIERLRLYEKERKSGDLVDYLYTYMHMKYLRGENNSNAANEMCANIQNKVKRISR